MIVGTTLSRILRRLPPSLQAFSFASDQKPSGILRKSSITNEDPEEKTGVLRQHLNRTQQTVKQNTLRNLTKKTRQVEQEEVSEPAVQLPKKRQKRKSEFLQQVPTTSYKYQHREIKIQQFIKKSQNAPVGDVQYFPFVSRSNIVHQKLQHRVGSYYINDKLKEQLTKLSQKLTQSLVTQATSEEISKHIEPTFELFLRRIVRQYRDNGWKIEVKKTAQPKIQILDVRMVKGMKTTRNNNFTSGEYHIQRSEQKTGLVWYLPHITENGNIEEVSAQLSQIGYSLVYNMILQVVCQIDTNITVSKGSKSENIQSAVFTFENQMRWPPMFSELKLRNEIYDKLYRVQRDGWVLTDVNQRNPYVKFEYTEEEKRQLYSRVL